MTALSTSPQTGLGGTGEEGSRYPAIVQEQGRQAGASEPTAETVKCPETIAGRLQIPKNEFVVRRRQQRYIDDTVWSVQESYYPRKWVTQGAERLLYPEDIAEGTVNYLAEAIGVGARPVSSSARRTSRRVGAPRWAPTATGARPGCPPTKNRVSST